MRRLTILVPIAARASGTARGHTRSVEQEHSRGAREREALHALPNISPRPCLPLPPSPSEATSFPARVFIPRDIRSLARAFNRIHHIIMCVTTDTDEWRVSVRVHSESGHPAQAHTRRPATPDKEAPPHPGTLKVTKLSVSAHTTPGEMLLHSIQTKAAGVPRAPPQALT